MMNFRAIFAILFVLALKPVAGQEIRMTLPPAIYAVPGVPVKIVLRNALLLPPGQAVPEIQIESAVGSVDGDGQIWSFIPEDSQVGIHPLKIRAGSVEKKMQLQVVPRQSGAGKKISLLIIGDSLTNATYYPNEIARLLSRPGNPEWRMLGTNRTSRAIAGVVHEGYGGWSWNRFVTRWEPGKPQEGKTKSSPFLFPSGEGKPQLDFEQYFHTHCEGRKPDFVTVFLGINDCFHADPDDPQAIDKRIDSMFESAEILIAELQKASPETEIGICLTPPANGRDEGFYANYKDRYTRWGWRRIQFRLVERQLEYFGNRTAENLYIIPTSLGIDPMSGYPVDNGVHPNQAGYQSLGREIYSWIKWRLSEIEG